MTIDCKTTWTAVDLSVRSVARTWTNPNQMGGSGLVHGSPPGKSYKQHLSPSTSPVTSMYWAVKTYLVVTVLLNSLEKVR